MRKTLRLFAFTLLLCFVLGGMVLPMASGGFSDLPNSHWAYDDILTAVQEDIVRGYPDGSFHPNDKVTFGEFVKMAVVAKTGIDPGGGGPGGGEALPGFGVDYTTLSVVGTPESFGATVVGTLYENGDLVLSGSGAADIAALASGAMDKLDIQRLYIQEGITALANSQFQGATNLSAVSFPDSLTSIGASCFKGCGFTSLTVPAGITWGSTPGGSIAFANNISLSSVTFEEGFEVIPAAMFIGCPNLTSVEFAESITAIYRQAFYNSPISEINLPANLTLLSVESFWSATATSVTLPASVTQFEHEVFSATSPTLTSLYLEGDFPDAVLVGRGKILLPPGTTIYYHEGAAGWRVDWSEYTQVVY